MRAVLCLFGMLGVTACGVEGSGATVGSNEEAIQGGAIDHKDSAVGMVWLESGGFCTGTLIAPDVVLTAGHCVEETVAAFEIGAGTGTHAVGLLPSGGFVGHAVIDQIAHPSYYPSNQCPNPSFDVGLLHLAQPLALPRPLALGTSAPAPGDTCRTVGYGMHNKGKAITVEQRRSATETVLAVDKSSVKVTRKSGIVDHGDSGGPLLCGGSIVGATSCGKDGVYPHHREAYYARVDSIEGWIQQIVDGWKNR